MEITKIIISILILIFLYGCGNGGDKDTIINPEEIYSGTEGLFLSFLENTPPPQVYENENFPVAMSLENRGANDIQEGYLAITLDKDYMLLDKSSLSATQNKIRFKDIDHIQFNLEGKSLLNPVGSQDKLTFSIDALQLEKMSETHRSPIIMTACYDYQTKLSQTVCIDADMYNLKVKEKACQVQDYELNSQGAPVAITKIETSMGSSEEELNPRFTIYFENKGTGQTIDNNFVREACYASSKDPLNFEKWNKVKAKAFLTRSGEKIQLDCDISDETRKDVEVRLRDNQEKIRCLARDSFNTGARTFSTVLLIELAYGYTESIAEEVNIDKV